jgi:glycogen phosphorylase
VFAEFSTDVAARIDELEAHLLPELRPLADVAYNYRWSWAEDGPALFAAIDRHRWRLAGENPVQFLLELSRERQQAAAADPALVERVARLAQEVAVESVPRRNGRLDGPVAFFCAEFGVHASLPIYSGGLGVLAGDFLKEASDRALPMIGVGLFYRRGYFCQRFDLSGVQQEYWLEHDPQLLPLSLVYGPDGTPLRLSVSVLDRTVAFAVWCVQVGRVPLLLLDAELAENDPVARWTTARLYDGNKEVRLTQYGLLGMGGARVLEALGIEPALLHLNEGHPALAPLELVSRRVGQGTPLDEALESLRERIVFTTHTPVPAGNETYPPALFGRAFAELASRLGLGEARFLDLCRARSGDPAEEPGMSALAMRIAGQRNGVSRLHGEVAREMWRPLFRNGSAPIDHVTNGIHVPTFLGAPMRRLLETHLGEDWQANAADPAVWEAVRAIPNAELWRARNESRRRLVEFAREKAMGDRLLRGEQLEYAEAGVRALDPDRLTFGFARRLTAYKRLALLVSDPDRAQRILVGPPGAQLLVAGKAHPRDDEGKRLLQHVAGLWRQIEPEGDRVWFLDNYNLSIGRELVTGCDVWLNVPMRGLEASGTSGMKAVYNGGLHLSVLDGWWAEAYNGANGWAISGDGDREDASELYALLEDEVIPLFYTRGDDGVPHGWCERIKESLITCGPAFTATRMLDDYTERIYRRFQNTVVSQ